MTAALKRAPSSADQHLWADYFELTCLLDEEGRVSRGDVEEQTERTEDTDDTGIYEPLRSGALAAELVDGRSVAVHDLFSHLEYRRATFGDFYPFELANGGHALVRLAPEPGLAERRALYVLLLIASALEHLEHQESQEIAEMFETIATAAIRAWLPPPAQVHHFGTRAPASSIFSGDLRTKVKELAERLGEEPSEMARLYREPNLGDGGLDVVAWFPFTDSARAALAIFVQATCRKDWVDKPGEIRYDKWKQRLTLLVQPPSVLVIPYCFRTSDGDWYLAGEITSVTVDRQRIIDLLRNAPVELSEAAHAVVRSFGAEVLGDDTA